MASELWCLKLEAFDFHAAQGSVNENLHITTVLYAVKTMNVLEILYKGMRY